MIFNIYGVIHTQKSEKREKQDLFQLLFVGIAILYREPTPKSPTVFAFMDPFSTDVWILLGVGYILVSLCFFCLGRVSVSQWENR